MYHKNFQYLWEINIEIILYLLKCFNINIEIIKSSDLHLDQNLHRTDALVAILKTVGATTYLSGPSGRNYLEFTKFQQNDIDLTFINFQHPVYPQRYSGFESKMSAIDLLFNVGPNANQIIETSGTLEKQ